MSVAYRCEVDAGQPAWRIERRGDAIITWACDQHLPLVCRRLQRGWERTTLTVVPTQHATGGTDE